MRGLWIALISMAWLLVSTPASALSVAVIDFKQALNEIEEGKKLQAELQKLQETKEKEIMDEMKQFQTEVQQFQSQSSMKLLQEAELQKRAQALQQKEMQLQQKAQYTQMELQQVSNDKLAAITEKMKNIATELGAERKIDLVIDKNSAIYHSSSVPNITRDFIKRYNAKHGG